MLWIFEFYFSSKQNLAMTRFELRTSCMAGFYLIHLTISFVEDLIALLTTYSKTKLILTQIPEDLPLNWEYPTRIGSSFWNIHKSDDILNGIMLTNICNLTEQKIVDFIEKCEWKTLEVLCFIRISLFFYRKMRIYIRIPWKQRKYQIRICSACTHWSNTKSMVKYFKFFSLLTQRERIGQ